MGFATTFDDLKTEIQHALQFGIATTVQSIHDKVDKIDAILSTLFQQRTPEERDLETKVAARGGKEKCLEDPAAIRELAAFIDPGTEPATSSLLVTLHAELDTLLDENMIAFKITIDQQTKILENAIKASETRVIAILQSGPHELIEDHVKSFSQALHRSIDIQLRTFD